MREKEEDKEGEGGGERSPPSLENMRSGGKGWLMTAWVANWEEEKKL